MNRMIHSFVQEVLYNSRNENKKFHLWTVSKNEASNFFKFFRINLEGYEHRIDNYSIKHIFNSHGDLDKEVKRGQLPIHKDHFNLIPDILLNYDEIQLSLHKKKYGIIYKKSFSLGTFHYIEEIRTGKKELITKSMRVLKKQTDLFNTVYYE